MKKEEILKASIKENKKKDMYEIEMERKGAVIAAVSMVLLAGIYYSYEIISGKGSNPALYSLVTLYCTIVYGYKAIKVEKNRKLNTFTSIIWCLLTIVLVLSYFKVI